MVPCQKCPRKYHNQCIIDTVLPNAYKTLVSWGATKAIKASSWRRVFKPVITERPTTVVFIDLSPDVLDTADLRTLAEKEQYFCSCGGSASNLSYMLHWSDEEHNLLVGMTEDQLSLEETDESNVITWEEHWRKVSKKFSSEGLQRTADECSGYWDFKVEPIQNAIGLDWWPTEKHILVTMTKEQLCREKDDPLQGIKWSDHWLSLSDRLRREGFGRTPSQCAAYWEQICKIWQTNRGGFEN
jgi:hypothetical protein